MELIEQIKLAEKNAFHRCGCSDILYEKLLNEYHNEILNTAPESEREAVKLVLIEHGYVEHFIPFVPDENECGLTGIDVYCCPCGRHE